jgi:tetratricopeptide (TPR) repeat protein
MYWRDPTKAMNADDRFHGLISEGLAASQGNRRRAALDFFAQASAVQPSSGIPHFLIGSEQAAAGDLDAAEVAFANAVLLAPEFLLARYQLGLLQFSSNRAAMAMVTWGPLLALAPAEPLGHYVRGFAALAQDRFTESVAQFEAGLDCEELNPAVAADIRQVVEAVRQLAARAESSPVDEPIAGHVLLASYGRGVH